MSTLAAGVAPVWAVVPMAIAAIIAVCAHLAVVGADPTIPRSRRRLRTACGVVMLAASVELAYASAFVSPANPRAFAFAWVVATALLLCVVGLALVDMLNSFRLAGVGRRRLSRAGPAHDNASLLVSREACTDKPASGGPAGDAPADERSAR